MILIFDLSACLIGLLIDTVAFVWNLPHMTAYVNQPLLVEDAEQWELSCWLDVQHLKPPRGGKSWCSSLCKDIFTWDFVDL